MGAVIARHHPSGWEIWALTGGRRYLVSPKGIKISTEGEDDANRMFEEKIKEIDQKNQLKMAEKAKTQKRRIDHDSGSRL